MNWDDLRLVLAVVREGTLSGAARHLRVTHSTVFRRLGAIEDGLGVRLFERFRDGYSATPAGEAAAALASRFADEFVALERRLSGQDLRPSGMVRIATTDTVSAMLMRHVPALRAAHPEISLEVTVSNVMANLTRREADVAIRPAPEPPETLVGRRIATIAHAVYGSPAYLSRHGRDPSKLRWIGLDDTLATTVIGRWMRDNVGDGQIGLRVDALPALKDAVCAGVGVALLPCYLGDTEAQLRRVPSRAGSDVRSALWLLTHSDLRRTARIRAVMDFLAAALGSERALVEGKRYGKALRGPGNLRRS
ncbi:MAG TPA: LysR family transcriptional regulator [Reyranella sp.]|nr:LysR family transcriptional regulator [Reyranella sp.]